MRYLVPGVLVSCLLAACGGGGGGGNSPNSAQNTPKSLALNERNYVEVSQTVLDGTESLSTLASTNSSLLAGAQVSGQAEWMPALLSQLRKAKTLVPQGSAHLAGAVTSESVACDISGSILVSFNDVNGNDELDPGDSFSMRFNDCVTSDGRLNGGFEAVFNNVSDGAVFVMDASIRLNDFSLVAGSSEARASGDMRLKLEEQFNRTTVEVTGKEMKSSNTLAGVTSGVDLSNYSTTLVDSFTVDSQTFEGVLSLRSYDSQRVSIRTTQTWLIQNGGTYPYAGQMEVTGAAGSKLRLTAQSSSWVRMELDANGDGFYEKIETRLWSSLR
jgi:hypothetical protein